MGGRSMILRGSMDIPMKIDAAKEHAYVCTRLSFFSRYQVPGTRLICEWLLVPDYEMLLRALRGSLLGHDDWYPPLFILSSIYAEGEEFW